MRQDIANLLGDILAHVTKPQFRRSTFAHPAQNVVCASTAAASRNAQTPADHTRPLSSFEYQVLVFGISFAFALHLVLHRKVDNLHEGRQRRPFLHVGLPEMAINGKCAVQSDAIAFEAFHDTRTRQIAQIERTDLRPPAWHERFLAR